VPTYLNPLDVETPRQEPDFKVAAFARLEISAKAETSSVIFKVFIIVLLQKDVLYH
jgi:hypothetical protein